MQKEADVRHREIEMIGHVGIDHFPSIHVKARSKTPVEPGKMVHPSAIGHRREQRYKILLKAMEEVRATRELRLISQKCNTPKFSKIDGWPGKQASIVVSKHPPCAIRSRL